MNRYKPKININNYTDGNELNARIYQVLLNFQNSKAHCKNKLNPLRIFNEAYAICEQLKQEQHPEQTIQKIWERLRKQEKILLCEANIIFSCVYVISLFSKSQNPNMQFFLTCCKQRIDENYLQEFDHLIREELTQITPITDDFEALKKEANKIHDLNERELFYAGYLAHYKQVQHKGNIAQQISDEIELIQRTKELSILEQDSPDTAKMKVKAFALFEFLKANGISTANHDLTKICKFIAFMLGNSYHNIYKELQKGITFKKCHHQQIDEINKIFAELNIYISIEK
jgi:cell division protein FtsL